MNIEIIETALVNLANGTAQPSFESPEFIELVLEIRGVSAADYQLVGARALQILLERLQAGMQAERFVRIIKDGKSPLHLC